MIVYLLRISFSVCPLYLPDTSINYIVNGDFEIPNIAPNNVNMYPGSILGWSVLNNLEVGLGNLYNVNWPSTTQVIELDVMGN